MEASAERAGLAGESSVIRGKKFREIAKRMVTVSFLVVFSIFSNRRLRSPGGSCSGSVA